MSLDARRKRIHCDSSDCRETVSLPIVHLVPNSNTSGARASSAAGWAFVRGSYEDRHYCPRCTTRLLARKAA